MQGIEQISPVVAGMVMLMVGILAGLVLARIIAGRRSEELEKKLDDVREDHVVYRKQVQDHFEKTGELFQEMGRSYKMVYDHLAQGAHSLCGEGVQPPRIDLPDSARLTRTAPAEGAPAEAVASAGVDDTSTHADAEDSPAGETGASDAVHAAPESRRDADAGEVETKPGASTDDESAATIESETASEEPASESQAAGAESAGNTRPASDAGDEAAARESEAKPEPPSGASARQDESQTVPWYRLAPADRANARVRQRGRAATDESETGAPAKESEPASTEGSTSEPESVAEYPAGKTPNESSASDQGQAAGEGEDGERRVVH